MTKYRVYLEAVASVSVEVEAESEDEAIDLAFEETPNPAWNGPDMGDWYFPGYERPGGKWSDYIEVIEESTNRPDRSES